MRKRFLFFMAIGAIVGTANAQLNITKQGQSLFGKRAVILGNIPVDVDSTATAIFLGNQYRNGGSHITFGSAKDVTVGEQSTSLAGSRTYTLELYGKQGFIGTSQGGTVFQYRGPFTTSRPFIFYTDVRANGVLLDSDSRIKSNVNSLDNSAHLLSKISPISYSLVAQSVGEVVRRSVSDVKESADTESLETTPATPDDRVRYGFMAQEIKEIFPDLVVESEDGTMAIDYIGFIPLLVDAVKSLQTQVDELVSQNGQTQGRPMSMPAGLSARSELIASGASLSQNRPNPFRNTTSISCVVPSGVSDATVFVYDLQGKHILSIPVEDRGETSVTVASSSLQPGMYIYCLVADGIEIDSKRMILTD